MLPISPHSSKYGKLSKTKFAFSVLPIPYFINHPPSLFNISSISRCSVVAVSLCWGEACMCILTWGALWFPPVPTRSAGCLVLWTLINKGMSTELLLKVMETDGCCCLQVQPVRWGTCEKWKDGRGEDCGRAGGKKRTRLSRWLET